MYTQPRTVNAFRRLRVVWFGLWLVSSGAAFSQQAREGFVIADALARDAAGSVKPVSLQPQPLQLGSFASFDISAGPDQRPRRSLRFRFDSATRAMRDFGIEAQDCATVVRSANRRSSLTAAGASSRLQLSLALNCRFF
jgi:hypothetical protein